MHDIYSKNEILYQRTSGSEYINFESIICPFLSAPFTLHLTEQVVLGMVDLEDLVSELNCVADWEFNFRAIKSKGRDAEKLPNTIKVRFKFQTIRQSWK